MPKSILEEGGQQSSWYGLRNKANLYVETDAETGIEIDGQQIGVGPGWYQVPFEDGDYQLRLAHPSGIARTQLLSYGQIRNFRIRSYLLPDRNVSRRLIPIPGATQWYEGNRIKSVVIAGVFVYGTTAYFHRHMDMGRSIDAYEETKRRYKLAGESTVIEWGQRMDAAYADYRRALDRRNHTLQALGAFYAVHLLDALWPRRGGYRTVIVQPDPYAPGGTVRIAF